MPELRRLHATFGVEPQPWTPPQPRELPALREALAEQTRSPMQHRALVHALSLGLGTMSPHTGDLDQDATILLDGERRRLAEAVLYYVTADMTRLAMAAAETLPVHTFHAQDVPTDSGFLLFAEPIGAYHPHDKPTHQLDVVTIVAASWGPINDVLPGPPGVWVTFYAITDYEAEARWLHQQGMPLSHARQRIRQIRAELGWDNEVTLRYGSADLAVLSTDITQPVLRNERIDATGGWDQIKDTTLGWAHIVRATWLLMTQPGVTDVDEQLSSRTLRRRAQREGYNPAPVRVVSIHHRADTPIHSESSDGRTYRVRWTVRGHWRNQWYPSRQEHRPVWINPHIKGPDGAPLHTAETVHLLDAPGP